MPRDSPSPLERLDTGAVARALALVGGGDDDLADVCYERRTDSELVVEPAGATGGNEPALRIVRERGLAARLVRGERAWLSVQDDDGPAELQAALRAISRALPPALPSPEPHPEPPPAPENVEELAEFPGRLERALRRRLLAFPYRIAVRRHERTVRVVTARTASPVEHERFASLDVATEFGRVGALALALDDDAAERLAERLALRRRWREAPSPAHGAPPLLLAPSAAAIALHEAVAHALEADLLAATGNPEAADGIALGGPTLDILDDPSSAPEPVRRRFDDEGVPTLRRLLVRGGRVAQPISDLRHARRFAALLPGSGFRADRTQPPLPRTLHLELPAGGSSADELLAAAQGGLAVSEIVSGALDPSTGRFTLLAAGARRIEGGALGAAVGPFAIRGTVGELLAGFVALGAERELAGAGWCAKEGQRRAVWATVPAVVASGLEIVAPDASGEEAR